MNGGGGMGKGSEVWLGEEGEGAEPKQTNRGRRLMERCW